MPATFDPATALVLIDLQHGITSMPTAHPTGATPVTDYGQLRAELGLSDRGRYSSGV